MQEGHDFYTGRGENARYLGTIWFPDGYRDGLKVDLGGPEYLATRHLSLPSLDNAGTSQRYTQDNWEQYVYDAITLRQDLGGASRSWPHPHKTTRETEWTWAFDTGAIYLHRFGAIVRIYYPTGGTRSRLRWPEHR